MKSQLLLLAVTMLSALSTTGLVRGEERYWVNPNNGAFGTPGATSVNWSATAGGAGGATVPASNDIANFTPLNSGFYTVTLDTNVTNQRLETAGGSITLDLGGRTYTLTGTLSDFNAVRLNAGSLSVQNGALEVDSDRDDVVVVAPNIGSTATLDIAQGGRLGSTANRPQLFVGREGMGYFRNYGVASVANISIGVFETATGYAQVSGPSARLDVADHLSVGGVGQLDVDSGSTVTTSFVYVEGSAGSSGKLNLFNGGSLVANFISIDGRLDITSGSTVTTGRADVGVAAEGKGKVTVQGTGSQWTINGASGLFLGNPSGVVGALDIIGGGTVSVTNGVTIHPGATLNISGGTLNLGYTDLRGGSVNFTGGTIAFTEDKNFTSTDVTTLLGNPGTLLPGRTLSVASVASLTGPLTIDGGTLTVSSLLNQSTFTLHSGTLNVFGADGLNLKLSGLNMLSVPVGAMTNVTNNLQVESGDQLQVNGGNVTAGSITNLAGGRISLDGPTARVSSLVPLSNSGVVTGNGTISAQLLNNNGGDVRPSGGMGLLFDGSTNANSGNINLSGSTIEFAGSLINSTTGFVGGRGSLIAAGIDNSGTLAFTGGTSDVFGNLTNRPGSRVVTSGNGVTTFYDDVEHDGAEIRTSIGSRSVFFGTVSGSGPFTGAGVVELESEMRPGGPAQLALTSFGGDLEFGGLAQLSLELAGSIRGIQYDAINIAGQLSLGGTLDVSLLAGFVPQVGSTFQIISANGVNGTFMETRLPGLGPSHKWDVITSSNDVWLRVGLVGDFDHDLLLNCADVDALVGVIAGASNNQAFDLTADGLVNSADLSQWLALAGANNLPSSNPFLHGDGNLDGVVDGQDFILWNNNKFTSNAGWCGGDFNADGVVDGQDFIEWNNNKFMSADGMTVVPEPGLLVSLATAMICLGAAMTPIKRAHETCFRRCGPSPFRHGIIEEIDQMGGVGADHHAAADTVAGNREG